MPAKKPSSRSAARVPAPVLAYDIGGTKVHAGVVDSKGRIIAEVRELVDFSEGRDSVIRQWVDAGLSAIQKASARDPGIARRIRRVGVASAGPLDPMRGLLLDPTNFGNWGVVPVARLLSKGLGGREVLLENDAAAAILAEHWVGAARRFQDAMILTLGTGLGTGIIVDGKLVRAGRHMHTEGGHLILKANDASAACACGNLGCAEAYLSGRGFERRAHARFGEAIGHGAQIAQAARDGDARMLALFEEYAELLATEIHNLVVLYAPKVVILAGSFAQAADLFVEQANRQLERLLMRRRHGVDFMPHLVVSRLDNRSGLLGGAYVALKSRL